MRKLSVIFQSVEFTYVFYSFWTEIASEFKPSSPFDVFSDVLDDISDRLQVIVLDQVKPQSDALSEFPTLVDHSSPDSEELISSQSSAGSAKSSRQLAIPVPPKQEKNDVF